MNFQRALDAGLTQSELAHVLGVSRVTVNLWVHGKMKPHRYNIEHVRQRMGLLDSAIERHLLPRSMGRRVSRRDELDKILRTLEVTENAPV